MNDPAGYRNAHTARDDYPYWLAVPLRFSDIDVLGHLNNVLYFRFFEAVIVKFLIDEAELDWRQAAVIPYAVDIRCHFRKPIEFPGTVDAGLRIGRLGTSSVTYALSIFAEGDSDPAALGHFVHVYVERAGETPVSIPAPIRAVYERFT